MKNIGFIGAFDKLDLLLYLAKIFTMLKKKVVVVDTTLEQKSKYIVPFINPTKCYITRFEDIDIAIGFESYEEIERYIGSTENKRMNYDLALVSIDTIEGFEHFNNQDTIKNYFTTSYEAYSIRKGLEAICNIKHPIDLTRVVFSTQVNEEDNYYLEYLALGYKVRWDEKTINFPYDTKDMEVMIENQRTNKIRLRTLSQGYRDSLEYLVMDIMPNINLNELRKVMKIIEKEG